FFQAEDGIRDFHVTGVQTCALPIWGIVVKPSTTPHWLPYIDTSDIEALVEQARGLGASVIKEVTSLSNGGKYAQLRDPQGAAFRSEERRVGQESIDSRSGSVHICSL